MTCGPLLGVGVPGDTNAGTMCEKDAGDSPRQASELGCDPLHPGRGGAGLPLAWHRRPSLIDLCEKRPKVHKKGKQPKQALAVLQTMKRHCVVTDLITYSKLKFF